MQEIVIQGSWCLQKLDVLDVTRTTLLYYVHCLSCISSFGQTNYMRRQLQWKSHLMMCPMPLTHPT